MVFSKKIKLLLIVLYVSNFSFYSNICAFLPWQKKREDIPPCILKGHSGKKPHEVCKIEQFLNSYQTNTRLTPAELISGYIFHGEPGTGKTTTIELLEKNTGARVIYISGSSLLSQWQNGGAVNVRKHYEQAIKLAKDGIPVIVFIDEADAVSNGNREHMQEGAKNTLLELMQFITKELDKEAAYCVDENGGIKYYEDEENQKNDRAVKDRDEKTWKIAPIITIAATNKLSSIDEALDTRTMFVKFPLPDLEELKKIIGSCNSEWDSQLTEKDIDTLTHEMKGYSQRDIVNVFKLARRNAKMAEEDSLSMKYVEESLQELKNKKAEIEKAKSENQKSSTKDDIKFGVGIGSAVVGTAAVAAIAYHTVKNLKADTGLKNARTGEANSRDALNKSQRDYYENLNKNLNKESQKDTPTNPHQSGSGAGAGSGGAPVAGNVSHGSTYTTSYASGPVPASCGWSSPGSGWGQSEDDHSFRDANEYLASCCKKWFPPRPSPYF